MLFLVINIYLNIKVIAIKFLVFIRFDKIAVIQIPVIE